MRHALVGLLLGSACGSPTTSRPSLVTFAEHSHYQRTGRYDEALQLCRDFARSYDHVACDEIGRTGEDRPIVALRIQRKPRLPVIYIQAGIHAGEIEGKDAGFALLRDLLDGTVAPGALDAVSVVFVPVLNPDGHERFGPNNRPNQRGPAEMGFRSNAARLNINRDFVKADTPEIHAVLGVLRAYDPVLLIDLHTTDGAQFEHDISINFAPVAPRGDQLDETANALRDRVARRLAELGHMPVTFYPSFVDDDNPLSGFSIGEPAPRFSQSYMATRGRLGLLVETHSWRTYPERVKSTYHTLQAVFETATTMAPGWRAVADSVDQADTRLGGSKLALAWKPGTHHHEIEFRGYAFDRSDSEISGGTWLSYDETKPQIWRVPLFDELVPEVTVDVPRAGYIVDGGFANQVATLLDRHGIVHRSLAGTPTLAVEAYRATKPSYLPPFEGRTRVTIEGGWAGETRTLDRGAMFVPIAQPRARIVVHLFDPALPDSLAQWGYFNATLEQKEYMESYVAEQQARDMLARDPTLRAAFDAALAADPKLAKSPARRLQWFYKRHPAWDERVNLLPVYRVANDPR